MPNHGVSMSHVSSYDGFGIVFFAPEGGKSESFDEARKRLVLRLGVGRAWRDVMKTGSNFVRFQAFFCVS